MGCKWCGHLGFDDDGSDYPSQSWPVCTADMPVSNLKWFPFKKVPKPCKGKAFYLDPWMLPLMGRWWIVSDILCGRICSQSTVNYELQTCYRKGKCDAFMHIVNRTDIPERELCDAKVQEMLVDKRWKGFMINHYRECEACNGEGGSLVNKWWKHCEACDGKGRFIENTTLP